MSRIISWTNSNQYRRYPLVDDASYAIYRVDDGVISNFTFNNNVLLDFSFTTYLRAAPVITLPYLDITNTPPAPANCRLVFSVKSGDVESLVWITVSANSTFPITIDSIIPGQYRLRCIIGAGVLDLCNWDTHRYYFKDPPVILPSCVVALDNHRVNAVRGSTVDSIRLTGDVYVEDGYNMALALNPDTNTLTVTAQVGAGQGVPCDVLPTARQAIDGIVSVNELLPDTLGNINILEGSGIKIDKIDDNTLVVKTTVDDNRIVCNP